MLPSQMVSSMAIVSEFIVPLRSNPLIDFELGSLELQNSISSNDVLWTCFYQDSQIKIWNGSATHTLIHIDNVKALSFAFDQSMRPIVTYQTDACYLWWYDTLRSEQVTTRLGNYFFPQLSLDDHRKSESKNSDVILSYISADKLCIRYQRERYSIEHYITDAKKLIQTGMMKNNRFCFQYYNW